jgi:hypothetical protein
VLGFAAKVHQKGLARSVGGQSQTRSCFRTNHKVSTKSQTRVWCGPVISSSQTFWFDPVLIVVTVVLVVTAVRAATGDVVIVVTADISGHW